MDKIWFFINSKVWRQIHFCHTYLHMTLVIPRLHYESNVIGWTIEIEKILIKRLQLMLVGHSFQIDISEQNPRSWRANFHYYLYQHINISNIVQPRIKFVSSTTQELVKTSNESTVNTVNLKIWLFDSADIIIVNTRFDYRYIL